jgi:hypothetical protein
MVGARRSPFAVSRFVASRTAAKSAVLAPARKATMASRTGSCVALRTISGFAAEPKGTGQPVLLEERLASLSVVVYFAVMPADPDALWR